MDKKRDAFIKAYLTLIYIFTLHLKTKQHENKTYHFRNRINGYI